MKEKKTIDNIKKVLYKYKHGFVFIYFIFYIIWFNALEKNIVSNFNPVSHLFDDYIPFNEWFMIPYLLWFVYIFATFMYFFFTSKSEFYQLSANLFIGMTICLFIYTIWPNGHYLRPDLSSIDRSNIMIEAVKRLHILDTPTNVCPSIHAFNSIGAYIAIARNERLKSNFFIKYFSLILTILICMSTCFLKQHSVVDVFWAIILNISLYMVVYLPINNKEVEESGIDFN